jgi:hypothetical protein
MMCQHIVTDFDMSVTETNTAGISHNFIIRAIVNEGSFI